MKKNFAIQTRPAMNSAFATGSAGIGGNGVLPRHAKALLKHKCP